MEAKATTRRSPSAMTRPRARGARLDARGRIAWAFVFIAGIILPTAPAIAQAPDSTQSYWGEIPARSDSVSVPLRDKGRPIWENAVLIPYRVVTFPIALTAKGIGAGISALDKGSVIQTGRKVLGPRRGPFGFLVDFRSGSLTGIGGGLTAEHTRFLGGENLLRVRLSATTRHDNRAGVAVRFGPHRDRYWELGMGYRQRPNARFFGFGPDAVKDDESFFHQESMWAGTTVRRPLSKTQHVDVTAQYTSVATGVPDSDHHPATQDLFDPSTLAAYGRHSYGVSGGVEWKREGAALNRPSSNGNQSLKVSYFAGTDSGDASFWSFRGEAEQFFRLWYPLRVLALRGVVSWINDQAEDPVPFARLLTNDEPDLFRGYDDFRFRDRGITALTAEYRWPIWAHNRPRGPGLDAYLLTDWGQVFGDRKEISMDNMTQSYGGGIRLESGRGFVFRAEWARSEEGSMIRFRADQIFQYAKGGFISGREPIPDR